jgi:non-specific serine/threonine protein kinase
MASLPSADRLAPRPPPHTPDRDQAVLAAALPTSLTSFVGRQREIATVASLLRQEGAHLVTLTGPGGVGKTRLALRVAQDIGHGYRDGVAFVSLAPVADPELVAPTIAVALGVREVDDRPTIERLTAALRNRRLLLILDNLEHVLDAAPLVSKLLVACSQLAVLATSREVLRLSGEHTVALDPLGVPGSASEAEAIRETDAVQLFVARARAVRADFALTDANAPAVAEIVRRLDGLPLAIELAAARVGHLPPTALLTRLERRLPLLTSGARDAPARQRTLRDTIAWSYELLPPEEQVLFRHLAVFAGGCTLDAAEDIARRAEGDGQDDASMSFASLRPSSSTVLDGVASLVAKSLLRQEEGAGGEPRYAMLETVREYGLEQLAASGDEVAVRRSHAAWCVALAEETHREYVVPATWLVRLEREVDNFRAALVWTDRNDDTETELRLAAALYCLWHRCSHRTEGRGWLERALSRDVSHPSHARAGALVSLGCIEWVFCDHDRATAYMQEGLALSRLLDHPPLIAYAASVLAMPAVYQGRDDEFTVALLDESETRSTEIGDFSGVGWVRMLRGILAHQRGRPRQAITYLDEATALLHDVSDSFGAASSLEYLGFVHGELGDHARAATILIESRTQWREAGMQDGLVDWLASAATLASLVRRPEPAVRWFGAAEVLSELVGLVLTHPARARFSRRANDLRTSLGDARFDAAWAAGRRLSVDDAVAEALAMLAELAVSGQVAGSADPGAHAGLTPREREVLRLLVEGRQDREIADVLSIGLRTVESHVASILAKLGVETRTAAAAYAFHHGLVAAAPPEG